MRPPPLREAVADLPVLVAVGRAVGRVEHRVQSAGQALRIVLAGLQVVAGPDRASAGSARSRAHSLKKAPGLSARRSKPSRTVAEL